MMVLIVFKRLACLSHVTAIGARLASTKCRMLVIAILMAVILWCLTHWMFTDSNLKWSQKTLPSRDLNSDHFVLGRDQDIYMYSAFANILSQGDYENNFPQTEIVITTLDKSRTKLVCCVLFNDNITLVVTSSNIHFDNYVRASSVGNFIKEHFIPSIYVARQWVCRVSVQSYSLRPSYITLTSSSCSSDIKDYLPIQTPTRVPGGLALCGKIAHSGGLRPEVVIEWFELQRILGVDKILMFDLDNPENLTRVFRYYQELGILDLQPYELPGLPKDRSLLESLKHTPQFNHDETMTVLECRQRMAGYDYVMSHDADEFIIPRMDVTLKEFLKEKLRQQPNAAGFTFHTQFFLTTWEPTNPEEDLMVKRYRRSTVPRWECFKYVYLPSRVFASITHFFFPTSDKYTKNTIPPTEAVLHHYRQCPQDTWGTCSVATLTDDIMTRYRDLDNRVNKVRTATLTRPRWTPIIRIGS